MQQQPTYSAALADRSITIVPRPPPTKRQFAGVLNHDDLAITNMRRRAPGRMARHLGDTYPLIAQKAREPNLLGAVPCKTPDPWARPSNQGLMQRCPPFSRRRSPNRPSPNSISIATSSNQSAQPWNPSSTTTATKKMCAFDSRLRGEHRPLSAAVLKGYAEAKLRLRPKASGEGDSSRVRA